MPIIQHLIGHSRNPFCFMYIYINHVLTHLLYKCNNKTVWLEAMCWWVGYSSWTVDRSLQWRMVRSRQRAHWKTSRNLNLNCLSSGKPSCIARTRNLRRYSPQREQLHHPRWGKQDNFTSLNMFIFSPNLFCSVSTACLVKLDFDSPGAYNGLDTF